MNKLILISGLIITGLVSCEGLFSDDDLLTGFWKKKTENTGGFRASVEFYSDSGYRIVDLVNPHSSGIPLRILTITGEFDYRKGEIIFLTATVESPGEDSSGTLYPDDYIAGDDSRSPPIITGSRPIRWEVIRLTDEILEVKLAPDDTIVYERQ